MSAIDRFAGKLKDRITLQRRVSASNALGEESGTWSSLDELFAFVEPLRGREYFAAAAMQDTTDTRFVIRFRDDVTTQMRVMWRGKPYDITSAIDVEAKRKYLELLATSGIRDAH
jgi:SPP1 family predicted phage head-tail adaptor